MATSVKNLIPAVATHPGSILKKELTARGITQKDFAKTISMPAPNLSELIKGKRNITEAIAIKLEEALGIPYQNWMNLQNRYYYVTKCREELDAKERKAQAEEQSLRSRLNIIVLYKTYHIAAPTASERMNALKEHIKIDLNELQTIETNTIGFFKRSENLRIDEINMRTWLLLAWTETGKIKISEKYTPEKGRAAATRIAELANQGLLTSTYLKDILNRNGILYLHLPKLEAAPIDAYSMMVGSNPAIVVTYRQNDLDKLAFDVLHEIGHILLHLSNDKSYISVEYGHTPLSTEEIEADKFAGDTLIPPNMWSHIMSAKPKNLSPHVIVHTIAEEAIKMGISASIAVARYKHETRCYNIRSYKSPKINKKG